MSTEIRNKLDYIVVCVSEFANRYQLPLKDAYFYLRQHMGIQFLQEFYDVEHTLSFDDVVDDLTRVCARNGGMLA